jgi:hypothetical protein
VKVKDEKCYTVKVEGKIFWWGFAKRIGSVKA